jgi:hypothetical protein
MSTEGICVFTLTAAWTASLEQCASLDLRPLVPPQRPECGGLMKRNSHGVQLVMGWVMQFVQVIAPGDLPGMPQVIVPGVCALQMGAAVPYRVLSLLVSQ